MRTLVLVLVIGCGSSSQAPALDPARRAASLDDREGWQLCREMTALREQHVTKPIATRWACAGTAVRSALEGDHEDDAALRATCKAKLDACLAAPPELPADTCALPGVAVADPDCPDVTVGELRACASELAERIVTLVDDPCGALRTDDREASARALLERALGPACRSIQSRCEDRTKRATGDAGVAASEAETAEALAKTEAFTTEMCACKDRACAERVDAALTRWYEGVNRSAAGDKVFSEDAFRRLLDLAGRYVDCLPDGFTSATFGK